LCDVSEACWNPEATYQERVVFMIVIPRRNFVTAEQLHFGDLAHFSRKPKSRRPPIRVPGQSTHLRVHQAMIEIRPVLARRATDSDFAIVALLLEVNMPGRASFLLTARTLPAATMARLLTGIEEQRYFADAQLSKSARTSCVTRTLP
jgi:hypothetical protein